MDRLACAHQRVPQRGHADPSTYIESTPEGWWYSSALPDGDRLIAFHGDADGREIRRIYELGPVLAARGLRGLAGAIGSVEPALASRPKLCAANRIARTAAGDGWLAAGDSAITLDPLSSQGLFNALATGLEAGMATRGLLDGDDTCATRYAASVGRIWRAYVNHHAT